MGADPPIMLMGKLFGGVDPITRSRLQDEFLGIQKKIKKTVIFVTHDINEAIKMGDRIVLLNKGEIAQMGTPKELLSSPKDILVEDFMGSDRGVKWLQLTKVSEIMSKGYWWSKKMKKLQ